MTTTDAFGVYHHDNSRRTDYLYRVSLKCVVHNAAGDVLVVKEQDRDFWDIPGGGMDHGENIKAAIAREMREEVNMKGDFTYQIIAVEEAALLNHNFWQIRLIFAVQPESMQFSPGDDGDAVAFRDSNDFRDADHKIERRIYEYSSLSHKLLA